MTFRPAIALLLPLLAAAPPAAVEQQEEAFRISVDVNLVVLHVSVHDRHEGDVVNLRQQDFTVLEDGVPQTIRMFRRRRRSGHGRTHCRSQRKHGARNSAR